MRHICTVCLPDEQGGHFEQGWSGIITTCDVCGRGAGDDYGKVSVRTYFDNPRLPPAAQVPPTALVVAGVDQAREGEYIPAGTFTLADVEFCRAALENAIRREAENHAEELRQATRANRAAAWDRFVASSRPAIWTDMSVWRG